MLVELVPSAKGISIASELMPKGIVSVFKNRLIKMNQEIQNTEFRASVQ